MRSIDFNGVEIEFDERCIKSYRWQKAMTSGDVDRSLKAISRLFAGKDEYYAYAISADEPMGYEEWLAADKDDLDDSMDRMTELFQAVIEATGQTAKN